MSDGNKKRMVSKINVLIIIIMYFFFISYIMLIFFPNVDDWLCLDGSVKCIGHILWPSIWSKAISNGWCAHPRSHGGSHPCQYSNVHYLGILRAYFNPSSSKQRSCSTSSTLCQIFDPKSFCQCSSSLHY